MGQHVPARAAGIAGRAAPGITPYAGLFIKTVWVTKAVWARTVTLTVQILLALVLGLVAGACLSA